MFDVDETVLSSYAHMVSQDFGYTGEPWNAFVAAGDAPAIPEIKGVYDEARRLGLAVFFVTGRRDPRDRAGTESNLRGQGMGDYERLVMSAVGDRRPTAERKTEQRAAIEAEGFTIVANVGDQTSDLVGGHAERTFKVPDPFYLIP